MVKPVYIVLLVGAVAFVMFGGIGASRTAFGEIKKEGKNLKSYTKTKIDKLKKELDEIKQKQDKDADKK